jgi:mono/diheme cytochrome c family protein
MNRTTHIFSWLAASAVLAALAGCDAPRAEFRPSRLYIAKQLGDDLAGKGSEDGKEARKIRAGRRKQLETINESLVAMFGTPDEPFPRDEKEAAALGLTGVIDPAYLRMAAGPVGVDENGFREGLYRQHCSHCHGVTGDGRGPTAEFLNPYPRDFRMGKFKFKSTPLGIPPTDADLEKTLVDGIPGTAMPSFRVLLAGDEIKSMVNYVKYLAIRGEIERRLIDEAALGLGAEDPMDTSRAFLVEGTLADVVGKWATAAESATPVPARPEYENRADLAASIKRGNVLFHGAVGNCFSCHGTMAIGDGRTDDYDDWSKDFADWKTLLDPEDRAAKLAEYHALGGLGPRNAQPRNLRLNNLRGGRRPIDLYWRVRNGIEGTPMPAANPALVSDEDVWDIVNYVQSIPYETLSMPPEEVLENLRANP